MLVISRKSDERILFPTVGIALHVVRVQNNTVRLGIEAPPDVKVLRAELMDKAAADQFQPPVANLSHAQRNCLNKVTLSLHLLQRQLEMNRLSAAQLTLDGAIETLESLDQPRDPPKPPARCRTLVVEDETNERELLAGLLNMHGCECMTAADGAEALAYLEKNLQPDFVLLDMRMPHCDGPRTVQQIRGNPRFACIKVFAISGSTPEASGMNVGTNGVDAWFQKPLNPRKLWEAMQHFLPSAN